MLEKVKQRIAWVDEHMAGSVAQDLGMEALAYDERTGVVTLRCRTAQWMRNGHGVVHGGLCTTIADQSIGTVVACCKPQEGTCPTIDLHMEFHRPLLPDKSVLVQVQILSVTRSLIRGTARLYHEDAPEKLCVSASATFFYVPSEK